MTAKTPAKVHLRLRFQNLGKPRTAGLCGRVAGACDCGPLSCTKIERPSLLEKPPCKVRFFANRYSRKYRQKVTVTTLFQTTSHRTFSTSHTNAPRSLSRVKAGTHTRLSEKDRTQALTRRNRGCFRWSAITTLGLFCTVRKPCVAGYQNGKLCRFWVLAGSAPKERRKPAGQRCVHACRCSAGVAAPLGCVALLRCSFSMIWRDRKT